MKLPRDLAAADLEKARRRAFGCQFTGQSGSHHRLRDLLSHERRFFPLRLDDDL